jgi:DNA-binding NarL/FixJ family response regulator
MSVLDQIDAISPDIAILDISLGDLTGFEVARRLRDRGCPAKIIFLTLHEDADFVKAAFALGASGYVFKSRVTEDLIRAVDAVSIGSRFVSIPAQRFANKRLINKLSTNRQTSDL